MNNRFMRLGKIEKMKNTPELIIFDVNETLLDLAPLKQRIDESLNSSLAFDLWFSTLLKYSLVESITGEYRDFGAIGKATLKMTAQKFAVDLSEEKIGEILGLITKLKPYPEVPGALKDLKEAGFKLVALTNGGQSTVEEQLKYAGLTSFFDAVYSVESVKKFKPHPATYKYVLEKQDILSQNTMLIASHAWDIVGAQRAGLQTGFISRSGKFLYPEGDEPTLSAKSLQGLTKALLNR